jgi:hypothetical protein
MLLRLRAILIHFEYDQDQLTIARGLAPSQFGLFKSKNRSDAVTKTPFGVAYKKV